jgi:hypothetical protein
MSINNFNRYKKISVYFLVAVILTNRYKNIIFYSG